MSYHARGEYADLRCRDCGKVKEVCRCDSWNDEPKPVAELPIWTVRHFDLALGRSLYAGSMTRKSADFMARLLTGKSGPSGRKSRPLAQSGTVKVLRVLPVLRVKCSCPPRFQYDKAPRLETRWTAKGGM